MDRISTASSRPGAVNHHAALPPGLSERDHRSDHGVLLLQRAAGNAATTAAIARLDGRGRVVQRAPRVGTRFRHPAGSRSRHRHLVAEFDGRDFTLKAGSTVVLRAAAQSGRPVAVRAADARRCGGASSESYTNNPRYVGIADYGPIPEGEYRFNAADFAVFSTADQARMLPGGTFEDPFGRSIHGGDWGAGRSALTPVRVVAGPRGCGNTHRRSGFFLHGGSLAGSSGCIDVGNAGITSLLTELAGYRRDISVTVHYTHPAPTVGLMDRVIGGAVYPGQHDPTITDRLRGAWDQLTGSGER